ncbi:hypothetical protein [Sphingomonas sp.]|jgi:hypothetical protein|uniref:hypothetical protein n=1 Tax=Sphingomonas sp. TaxID=28214 RepID=UPI002E308A53|nr:hypothetical protein [Sphingomonas sp.]HEX4694205.1 hypothetical protein [Sphingomonas sp.]
MEDIARLKWALREWVVGYWDFVSSPMPDFIVVPNEEYDDALAWLAAYLPGLSPVSQWCRLWKADDFLELLTVPPRPMLDSRLAAWTGAIISELAADNPTANLKEASGAIALTTSTYSMARAASVWHQYRSFEELDRRHNVIFGRARAKSDVDGGLLPLWYVLSGETWCSRPPAEARALEIIRGLVDQLASVDFLSQEEIVDAATILAGHYDLPELKSCAAGPQSLRVEALDKLAGKLFAGPKTAATSAIMGFGASLIDPGAVILPELLRRYENVVPASVVWAGAFAGLWAPVRVMSEHAGLGRIISKELLSQSDLFSKPSTDISFEELSRWTGGSFNVRPAVRGLMARFLFVELMPGVAIPFSTARNEARTEAQSMGAAKQASLDLEANNKQGSGDILSRLEQVERILAELTRKAARQVKPSSRSSR